MALNAPSQRPPTFYPARFFMRPVWIDLGKKAFALGGAAVTFALRQLGYLDALLVHLSGTYTVANAPLVFNALMPYNVVKNFLVVVPGSPLPPINIGGQALHAWNLQATDFAPYVRGFGTPAAAIAGLDANAYAASILDAFPVALGAQTMHLWWVLPFHLAADDIRGTLPLGNSSVVNLIITPSSAAELVTVAANLTLADLSVDVAQVYLTPPPPGAPVIGGGVDPNWAVSLDETNQAIPAVGLQAVDITPNYTILGILHAISLNNALNSADVERLNVRLNSSWIFEPPGIGPDWFTKRGIGQEGKPLPAGLFLYDQDVLGMADWIHTETITEIQSEITIAAGAVLGATPRIYTSVRRLIDLNPASHLPGAG